MFHFVWFLWRQHTLAFTPSSGKMDSFGLGGNGQLGTRSTCNRKSPAPVKGPRLFPPSSMDSCVFHSGESVISPRCFSPMLPLGLLYFFVSVYFFKNRHVFFLCRLGARLLREENLRRWRPKLRSLSHRQSKISQNVLFFSFQGGFYFFFQEVKLWAPENFPCFYKIYKCVCVISAEFWQGGSLRFIQKTLLFKWRNDSEMVGSFVRTTSLRNLKVKLSHCSWNTFEFLFWLSLMVFLFFSVKSTLCFHQRAAWTDPFYQSGDHVCNFYIYLQTLQSSLFPFLIPLKKRIKLIIYIDSILFHFILFFSNDF